jgi:integrase
MPRHHRSAKLETRTARLKLAVRGKPYFVTVSPGIALGYRRNASTGAWIVRCADGTGGNWTKAFALADDHEQNDGEHVLTFYEAQDRARALARGKDLDSGRPGTVQEAIAHYATDLKANGGNVYNARAARAHLPLAILQKPVALLSERELQQWRNGLLDGRAPSTVNRIIVTVSAALELAADLDPRIATRRAWKVGLKKLAGADAGRARNVVLPETTVHDLVARAYGQSQEFGRFIAVMATTGARRIQLARLTVADLQDERPDPRLMMPSAVKGKRDKRRIDRRPVPIPASLATGLRAAAKGRAGGALLLPKPDGGPWRSNDPRQPFREIVEQAGLDPAAVTPYALRHTSIVRDLLANVPLRIVAAKHDTSVTMIERAYSAYIADHADELSRRAMLDLAKTPKAPRGSVVALKG